MVALESTELFRNLKPEELRALRQVTMEREFHAGQEIFREGDRGDGVYVVKEGLVEISGWINQETRRVLSHIRPGGIFGEMAIIEHRPRSASAAASKDTTAYFIPRGELLTLIERSPGLAMSVLQVISHRQREFNQHFLREVVQSERLAVLGRFSRSIVHDLKNPLNVIGLTTELACGSSATPQFRASAHDRVRKQIDRINDLIGEILNFTQGTGTADALSPMNYREFFHHILEDLREEAAIKSAKLQISNPPPDTKVMLNPNRLRRVFLNLIHNATDAMPQGGDITVHFTFTPRELITEVEDTGTGIAPEIADQLFQAFVTHGKTHGTGLGLSICKKIIEDHGGRIWARNEPGRGAVFAFALPSPKQPSKS